MWSLGNEEHGGNTSELPGGAIVAGSMAASPRGSQSQASHGQAGRSIH